MMNAENEQKAGNTAINYTTKANLWQTALKTEFDSLGVKYQKNNSTFANDPNSPPSGGWGAGTLLYFYHPDHLGSSSLVTDASGNITHHIEYVPYGEVFIEEKNSTWRTPYKFNAKELDEETGLYYYGARYYDPKTSVWISVDPYTEIYPGMSGYNYCADNPVLYIDPNGKWIWEAKNVRDARKEAKHTGGEFAKWKGKDGKTWASVDYSKSKEYKGNNATDVKVYKPEGKSWGDRVNDGRKWVNDNKSTIINVAQITQNVGDGIALAGYACTVSVIGAEVGVPLAAIGNAISGVGTGIEIAVELNSNDFGTASKEIGFQVAGILVDKGLNKVIPGSGTLVTKKGKDIGKEILMQGAQLKIIGLEKVVDAAVEKNKQNKQNP